MEDGRRLTPSHGSAVFPWSNDTSGELWHSTPVKKDVSQPSVLTSFRRDPPANQWAKGSPPVPAEPQFPAVDPGVSSTVQRQRRELQLLMAELKDREHELNSMMASQHKQLLAWEQDRQKVLSLEQRCSRLDDELQKRNEVIRVLTKRVWAVEKREVEVRDELGEARQKLVNLQQKEKNIRETCDDYQEQNQSLNSTVMSLSAQVGSLQVREEELSSMLKLKDRDVTEASGRVSKLSGRLRDLEVELTESQSRENKLQRDAEENKKRYRDARHEVTHLKEELQQQVALSSSQREEMIRLKQELQLLHTDLALTGEGDTWRDELLELARSKQDRTMSELRYLRQVCENQRNDLQMLQLNLESTREALREKTPERRLDSQDQVTCSCVDRRSSPTLKVKSRDPGLSSVLSIDGDDPLSSCLLQQMLKEESGCQDQDQDLDLDPDPVHSHRNQIPPSHYRTTPPSIKVGGTPPRVCPRHQTHTWTP